MVKKYNVLRTALSALAVSGLIAGFASCGSGLLDTEDESASPSFSVEASEPLADVVYGGPVSRTLTITLTNAAFADSFTELLSGAATTNVDLLSDEYFTVTLTDSTGENKDNLIEEDTLALVATSAMTVTGLPLPEVYTTSTFTPVSATFEATLSAELADVSTPSSGVITITTTQATGKAGLSATIPYSFKQSTAVWGLEQPAAKYIAAAAGKLSARTTVGVTVIDLPAGTRVASAIAEDTEIGTIGSTVTVKALTAIAAKANVIPVLLVSDGTSLAETAVTLNEGLINQSGSTTEAYTNTIADADLAKIVIPYYAETFESATAANWSEGVTGAWTPQIGTETGNKFLTVVDYDSAEVPASGQGRYTNNRWIYSGSLVDIEDTGDYSLSFDLKIASGNNQSGTGLYIFDNTVSETNVSSAELTNSTPDDTHTLFYDFPGTHSDNILFSLEVTAAASQDWKVNSGETVTLEKTYDYSVKNRLSKLTWFTVTIERTGSDTYVTIANKDGSATPFARQKVTASTDGIGAMMFTTGRYFANFAIDNIIAYRKAVTE